MNHTVQHPHTQPGVEPREGDSCLLAARYVALKEVFLRSAYKDCYTRDERMDMRAQLKDLGNRYLELTGLHLS